MTVKKHCSLLLTKALDATEHKVLRGMAKEILRTAVLWLLRDQAEIVNPFQMVDLHLLQKRIQSITALAFLKRLCLIHY